MLRMLAFQFWMKARVTVLGSGTSHGVPMIGCTCAVCRSADPRDRRTRPSIYVEVENGPAILVDTSTDLRAAGADLRRDQGRCDPLYAQPRRSHHGHGRSAAVQRDARAARSLPTPTSARSAICGARSPTSSIRRRKRAAAFRRSACRQSRRASTSIRWASSRSRSSTARGRSSAFVLASFAYLTDCNRLADEAWPVLDGVDILILDALRHRPHPTHFTVAEALEVVDAPQAAADLLHAHLPRPAARGDEPVAAGRCRAGL